MSGTIAAGKEMPLTKPLIIMSSNNLGQIALWIGLGVDLWAFVYGPGMWSTFGLGMIFVWAATSLQIGVLRDYKKRGVTGGRRLLARLIFLSLALGGIGNGIDLWIMGFVAHVPLGTRDWQLAGIAGATYLVLLLLTHLGRPLAPKLPLPLHAKRTTIWRSILFSPEKPYRDTRRKFIIGLSVRVAPQAGAAVFALHDHVKPMGALTLGLLSLLMFTFTVGNWWQQKGDNPSAEALSGLGLYGSNFVVTLGLIWALLTAQH